MIDTWKLLKQREELEAAIGNGIHTEPEKRELSWINYDLGEATINGARLRSKSEIECLKRDWSKDPIWDIELTEGYEAHYGELVVYRLQTEARWKNEGHERLLGKANELGVPGNVKLAQAFLNLENYIVDLENEVERLDAMIDGVGLSLDRKIKRVAEAY